MNEVLWEQFIDNFGTAFLDIGHAQKAYAEELLAGGLYHVATTSGTSPLIPEGPTRLLSTIT